MKCLVCCDTVQIMTLVWIWLFLERGEGANTPTTLQGNLYTNNPDTISSNIEKCMAYNSLLKRLHGCQKRSDLCQSSSFAVLYCDGSINIL